MSEEETPQTEQFLTLLKKGNYSERMMAAKRLGEQRAAKAVPALVDALNDPNQTVRGHAAWALGEIGDPAAIGPLIAAFIKYDRISETDRLFRESKCLTDFYLALEQLTGQKFGLDVEKWKKWYQKTSS